MLEESTRRSLKVDLETVDSEELEAAVEVYDRAVADNHTMDNCSDPENCSYPFTQ